MQSRTTLTSVGLLVAALVGCSPTDLGNTLPMVTITNPAPMMNSTQGIRY